MNVKTVDNRPPLILAVADLAYSDGEFFDLLNLSLNQSDLNVAVETVPLADVVSTAQRLQPALIIIGHRPLLGGAAMRERWQAAGSPMGGSLVKALKSDAGTRDIPVLLLEALADIESVAQECGADTYLPIPVPPQEFIETIRKLVHEHAEREK